MIICKSDNDSLGKHSSPIRSDYKVLKAMVIIGLNDQSSIWFTVKKPMADIWHSLKWGLDSRNPRTLDPDTQKP